MDEDEADTNVIDAGAQFEARGGRWLLNMPWRAHCIEGIGTLENRVIDEAR